MTDISKHPLAPSLHRPISMGTRVIADIGEDLQLRGTVEGVSMMHVAWAYIVVLDEPYDDIPDIGPVKAITALGTQLRGEDGADFRSEINQIRALRAEAAVAGDADQVAICDQALSGDLAARKECARVNAEANAEAMKAAWEAASAGEYDPDLSAAWSAARGAVVARVILGDSCN